MSLPILVHLLFVMKNPTMGSVTAPQALPMNNTIEAWTALICRGEKGQTGGVKNNVQGGTEVTLIPSDQKHITWATSSR